MARHAWKQNKHDAYVLTSPYTFVSCEFIEVGVDFRKFHLVLKVLNVSKLGDLFSIGRQMLLDLILIVPA